MPICPDGDLAEMPCFSEGPCIRAVFASRGEYSVYHRMPSILRSTSRCLRSTLHLLVGRMGSTRFLFFRGGMVLERLSDAACAPRAEQVQGFPKSWNLQSRFFLENWAEFPGNFLGQFGHLWSGDRPGARTVRTVSNPISNKRPRAHARARKWGVSRRKGSRGFVGFRLFRVSSRRCVRCQRGLSRTRPFSEYWRSAWTRACRVL